jgi:hypothetical protein
MLLTTVVLVIVLRRLLLNHRVFDLGVGHYWDSRTGGGGVPLAEVRGVQVVRQQVVGPESSYDADELNLVLVDGRRVNVLAHADTARVRDDARRLAEWLGVPLWSGAAHASDSS